VAVGPPEVDLLLPHRGGWAPMGRSRRSDGREHASDDDGGRRSGDQGLPHANPLTVRLSCAGRWRARGFYDRSRAPRKENRRNRWERLRRALKSWAARSWSGSKANPSTKPSLGAPASRPATWGDTVRKSSSRAWPRRSSPMIVGPPSVRTTLWPSPRTIAMAADAVIVCDPTSTALEGSESWPSRRAAPCDVVMTVAPPWKAGSWGSTFLDSVR